MAFLLLLVCVSVSLLLCYYVLFRMDVYRTPTAVMVLQRLLALAFSFTRSRRDKIRRLSGQFSPLQDQ
jgi:hypothetical protein